jgi:hypothetical protein
MRHWDPFAFLSIAKDVVLLLASVGAGTWAWFRTRHAHSWPSAQGTIVGARVHSSTGSFRPWVGDLSYTYVVNGEYYSGFHHIRAHSQRRAEDRIAGWKGRMVVVRYSPNQRDLSTLLRSDQPGGQLGN